MGYNQGRLIVDAVRTDISEYTVHHSQVLGEFG